MTPKGRGALLVRLICLGSALLWIVLVVFAVAAIPQVLFAGRLAARRERRGR